MSGAPDPNSPWARVAAIDEGGETADAQVIESLQVLATAAKHLDELTDRLILTALQHGSSVRDVAKALGVSSPGTLSKRLARIRAGRPPGQTKRRLSFAGSGASGLGDVSERVDDYLAEGFGEDEGHYPRV